MIHFCNTSHYARSLLGRLCQCSYFVSIYGPRISHRVLARQIEHRVCLGVAHDREIARTPSGMRVGERGSTRTLTQRRENTRRAALDLHSFGVRSAIRRLSWGGARKAVLHPKLLTFEAYGLMNRCTSLLGTKYTICRITHVTSKRHDIPLIGIPPKHPQRLPSTIPDRHPRPSSRGVPPAGAQP